jgi:Bromodomain
LNLLRSCRHDKFSVFADAVTEKEAPGYREIIKNPMDFGTMRKKIRQGKYGVGSKAVAALYHDFLLVFDNCFLYNSDESEVTEEASRMFGLLPEAYVSSCVQVAKIV